MKIIVSGYSAMIGDKVAVTILGKDGYTDFYTQSEIKKCKRDYRPVIYPTEKGARSAINYELRNYNRFRNVPQEKIDELKSKTKVVRVTATYDFEDLEVNIDPSIMYDYKLEGYKVVGELKKQGKF